MQARVKEKTLEVVGLNRALVSICSIVVYFQGRTLEGNGKF